MIDMSGAISLIGGYTAQMQLYRRARGVLHAGIFKEPTPPIVMQFTGSVQPGGRNEEILLEGVKSDDILIVFTTIKVQTAQDPAGPPADQFLWRGTWYEAKRVDDWSSSGISNYYKAIFARLRPNEKPAIGGAQ